MSIGPILPGRVPVSLTAAKLQQSLAFSNSILSRIQDQVSTGQKFFLPSDAPAAAVRTILLQRTVERKAQMQANINTDRSLLSAAESALATAGDALGRAKTLALSGVGDTASDAERAAMAAEVDSLMRSVLSASNTQFRGRYLFGGSETGQPPFEILAGGTVRYTGDLQTISSYIDFGQLSPNNVDGATAFGAVTEPVGGDVDPALTFDTRLTDLLGGDGVETGKLRVTLDNGGLTTAIIDLVGAKTIGDLKTRIENAFGPGDLTVSIAADNKSLRLVPGAGTIAVEDMPGFTIASDLDIKSGPVASITGTDLNPRLTLSTKLSTLNAGAGASLAGGLKIQNGSKTYTVDLTGAETVEDLFNSLKAADPDVLVGLNTAGNGFAISSRLNSGGFGIGENGGGTAAALGLRTFTADTLLSDLNNGVGVSMEGNSIVRVTLSDGTVLPVDLAGAQTIQQVIDRFNTAGAGDLTASLNSVGNGIRLTDAAGGATAWSIEESPLATALGLGGSAAAGASIEGTDVNRRETKGLFNILTQLKVALQNGDNTALSRIDGMITAEVQRFTQVRGTIAGQLQGLDTVENRLLDEEISLEESISFEFDVDMTEAVTQLAAVTAAIQATGQIAGRTLQLSLLNFL